jgi:hypothetical protein
MKAWLERCYMNATCSTWKGLIVGTVVVALAVALVVGFGFGIYAMAGKELFGNIAAGFGILLFVSAFGFACWDAFRDTKEEHQRRIDRINAGEPENPVYYRLDTTNLSEEMQHIACLVGSYDGNVTIHSKRYDAMPANIQKHYYIYEEETE